MTPLTLPLWKLFPIKIIQLAERFLTLTSFCIACLCAYSYPRLRNLSYALIIVCTGITLLWATHGRTTLAQIKENDPVIYRQYHLNIDQYIEHLTSPDLIVLYKGFTMYKTGFAQMTLEPLEIESAPEAATVTHGKASVTVREWKPRNILLHYDASTPSTLLIRQFMFPGFIATIGNKILPLTRDEHTGQIALDIPAGSGDIQLQLVPLIPEVLGKLVSLVSAIMVLLMGLLQLRRSRK